ncbi:MAG: hypothetical protein KDA62_10360, partial [Planctomycetales bacterium]|nr:hypothetical protein [Planctomycetales bacterium]
DKHPHANPQAKLNAAPQTNGRLVCIVDSPASNGRTSVVAGNWFDFYTSPFPVAAHRQNGKPSRSNGQSKRQGKPSGHA